jgi:hypothetical protein
MEALQRRACVHGMQEVCKASRGDDAGFVLQKWQSFRRRRKPDPSDNIC